MEKQLGRYVLERKLGSGGMAEVFLATQLGPSGFRRSCVVKRTLPSLASEGEFLRMFIDEARLAALLQHPNVVQIFDFGAHEGSYFIAMEYIPGADLKAVTRALSADGAFMPFPLAARLVAQTALALDYAHHATRPDGTPLNVVHRDVSPHNVILSTAGQVKLIDFGIAKAATASEKTRSGLVKGKYAYMSPEQIECRPLDGRSDLYALGLLLYELLAGRPAVPHTSVPEIMELILNGQLDPIQSARRDVPPELVAVLERALKRRPEQRFARGMDMADALERYIAGTGAAIAPADVALLIPRSGPTAELSDSIQKQLARRTTREGLTQTDLSVSTRLRRAWLTVVGVGLMLLAGVGAGIFGRYYWASARVPVTSAPSGSPSTSAASPR